MTEQRFRFDVVRPHQLSYCLLDVLLLTGVACLFATYAVAWSSLTTTTQLSASSLNVPLGTPVVITTTVTDQNGASITTGQVVLCDGSANFCQDTAILGIAQLTLAGSAKFTLRFGPGTHSIKAEFRGTQVAMGSTSAAVAITITGQLPSLTTWTQSSDSNHNSIYLATVTGSAAVAPTGSVSFVDTTNQNLSLATASLDSTTAIMFPVMQYPLGAGPEALAVGDFNGDGKPDLAVTDAFGTIGVLLGNGDGTFQAQRTYATGLTPFSLAVSDFDADGIPDLVVVNGDSTGQLNGSVGVLLGNGDGTFQAQRNYTTPGHQPFSLAVGDFNGDGRSDVVTTNASDTTISVLLGNGDGTFQAPQIFPAGYEPFFVAVADFNHDGVIDLAVSNGDNTVGILLGNGDGTFQSPHAYSTGLYPSEVAVGDFNGDGNPDLVVTIYYSGYSLGLFIGNGDGTFQPQQGIDPTQGRTDAVVVGDFNGDGKLDLVVDGEDGLAILLGNGDGTFQTRQSYPTGGPNDAIVVGDFNSDSKPDLATVTAPPALSVLLNGWAAQASVPAVPVPGQGETHAVIAAYAGDTIYPSSSSTAVNVSSVPMTLSSLNPTSAFAGSGSFTLTVGGATYLSGSIVQWNGSSLSTTFVSSSQLTAAVPASATNTGGQPNITVAFGQTSSNPLTFNLVAPYNAAASPSSLTITIPGGSASAGITLTPANGYSATVGFSCTVAFNGQGTPHEGPSCSMTQPQVSVAAPSNASTTLTVFTTAPHLAMAAPAAHSTTWLALATTGGLALPAALVFVPWLKLGRGRRLRRVATAVILLLTCLAILLLAGCGGGNSAGPDPGTTIGTYTVTVNATAGSYTSSVAVVVTVQ